MVHALQEAWRVLRPNSCLIDLRPATEHARIGLIRDGRFTIQWKAEESLESYRAASRSLKIVEDLRLFSRGHSGRFTCTTIFPSAQHLKDWLYDWYESGSTNEADDLVKRIENASTQSELTGQITAKVPFMLKVLVKRSVSP